MVRIRIIDCGDDRVVGDDIEHQSAGSIDG